MSNFAPSRTPKKGVCEWRIVSLATKTFWWNFTCCYFTIFFKFSSYKFWRLNLDLITLNWAEYLCRGIFTCRNLTIFFSNKFFRLNLDLILFRIDLNWKIWIWNFEKKIVKQQKVFDEKLGDKHQKWVQQQWRRYSTSPGSVCVLSLC